MLLASDTSCWTPPPPPPGPGQWLEKGGRRECLGGVQEGVAGVAEGCPGTLGWGAEQGTAPSADSSGTCLGPCSHTAGSAQGPLVASTMPWPCSGGLRGGTQAGEGSGLTSVIWVATGAAGCGLPPSLVPGCGPGPPLHTCVCQVLGTRVLSVHPADQHRSKPQLALSPPGWVLFVFVF